MSRNWIKFGISDFKNIDVPISQREIILPNDKKIDNDILATPKCTVTAIHGFFI